MATQLEELIQYWKDRLAGHHPWTGKPLQEFIKETIASLEELKKIKES